VDPFNKVSSKLYQGSVPDPASSYESFSMIVLCAQEKQPELPRFKGTILRPAFDDTLMPTDQDIRRARDAAACVGAELMRGGRVLVTCAAGLNRSGLVTGLALTMMTRLSATEIVRMIRAARSEDALGNETFHAMLFSAARLRDGVLSARSSTGSKHGRQRGEPARVVGRGR
jgi:protein-tyrosine phosphatase